MTTVKFRAVAIFCCLAAGGVLLAPGSRAADRPKVEADGTVHVQAFDLPESAYLSAETRAALQEMRAAQAQTQPKPCPSMEGASRADMPAVRKCEAEAFYKLKLYKAMRERYDVALKPEEIAGVYTEVFTPARGIAPENARRVLINVHGGGFSGGSRTLSHLESIPIAAVGRIKVVSIDYRMAPEYTFPAASEDVAAVYRHLLKTYAPKNIGLYGCSAGGALTTHAIAWFQKEKLPLPGAVGMFCYGAESVLKDGKSTWVSSDGAYLMGAVFGTDYAKPAKFSYYAGVDRQTPLASPGDYDEVMAKFPPALLISGTRDFTLSSVLATHAQLVRLGVEADLHVWEGMSHAFHFFPAFRESREAYEVIVKFFNKHLHK